MAKIGNNVLFREITGKLDKSSNLSLRRTFGKQHTYTLSHPRTDVPTEAMTQTRNNLAACQAFALAEMGDAQKLEQWTKEYKKALAEYRKNPSNYENKRRKALEAAGKRVRANSLEFPKTLRGYIISCKMLGE